MVVTSKKRSFEDLQVGDKFPPIVKRETHEDILRYSELASMPHKDEVKNFHIDEEYAKTQVFAGKVNAGVATVAYCLEALEQGVPAAALQKGGRIELKAIEPVRSGDTIVMFASVTGKREENGGRFVDFEVRVENQHGRLAAIANATARF
jgi:acyl dehydratase